MATTPKVLNSAFVTSTITNANQVESVTLSDGTFLVVYESPDLGPNTLTFAQQFSADGTPIGGEMNLGIIGNARLDMTALPGNKVAIVGDFTGSSIIRADVFEIRDGVAVPQDTEDEVFLFDNDGTFFNPTITSDGADGFDLHFAALESGVTTILDLEAGSSILNPTNFDFATEIESFTVNSRFRAELDSATLENGNVVLLIDRDGDDGNLRDIDFQILDKDGTTVAEGEIVSTRGKTFDGTVTALKGGGFVIAMSENDGDIDVRYQVFDENGQAVSGQNPFGTNFLSGSNNNNTPEIVALDDGGFIIFYGKDNGTEQLRGQRFDAEGNTVGDDFLVANENSKDISATALADGRIAVAFEANSGVIKTAIVTAGLTEVGTDGNDVFNGTDGEDDFIGGTGNDLFNSKGLGPDLFDGGDGFDTVSYADAPAGRSFFVGFQNTVTAEGAAPTFLVDGVDGPISTGAIRELRATDTLVSIEKVILGSGDDVVFAMDTDNVFETGAGNDRIEGGAGADIISGGAGIDTAIYTNSAEAVRIDLRNSDPQRGGDAEGDVLKSIENLVGSKFDDLLNGSAGANRIEGGAGNDNINGLGGNDTIDAGDGDDVVHGSFGNDTLSGGSGNDVLLGEAGDDILAGNAGDDTIDGGAGSDTASYADSAAGVNVQLQFRVAKGGDAAGDTLKSIENLIGSAHNDGLIGNQDSNILHGGEGGDHIKGLNGADQLFGEGGDDFLFVDSLDTLVQGGEGLDRLIVVNGNGVTNAVGANGIEIATGNAGDDNFDGTGATANLNLIGRGGNDVLTGGDGNDTLRGDSGADELRGGGGTDRLFVDENDTVIDGGAGDQDQVIVQQLASAASGVTVDMAASNVEIAFGNFNDDTFDGSGATVDLSLFGRQGQDVLTGGAGNDRLFGDNNDAAAGDVLNGGQGNDFLRGGENGAGGFAERDQFVFNDEWGNDRIFDFADNGAEKIDFSSVAGIDDLSDLTITDGSGFALISYHDAVGGWDASIRVDGVTAAQLQDNDFIFV